MEKLRAIIQHQGGDAGVIDDYRRLPAASGRQLVRAPRGGYLTALDAELVGRACVALGAGRDRVDDAVDPGVGAMLCAKPGDRLAPGDPIVELHYQDAARLGEAMTLIGRAFDIGEKPMVPQPLVIDTVAADV